MIRLLFLCLGNICRSPAAEGIALKKIRENKLEDKLELSSCGLGPWHVGKRPDLRMQHYCAERKIPLETTAWQFQKTSYQDFDYILVADQELLEIVKEKAPSKKRAKILLMTAFSERFQGEDIPDPYYHGNALFDMVLDMLEDSVDSLISELSRPLKLNESHKCD